MDTVRLRRCRNRLVISGAGVIAFGVWSVVKTVLAVTLRYDEVQVLLDLDGVPFPGLIRIFVFALVAIILSADLALRLFVGLSARSEGFGRKKHYVYIGLAVLMIVFSLWTIVFGFNVDDYDSIPDMAISLIVELTSDLALLEIVISAIIVKRLSKKAQEV